MYIIYKLYYIILYIVTVFFSEKPSEKSPPKLGIISPLLLDP